MQKKLKLIKAYVPLENKYKEINEIINNMKFINLEIYNEAIKHTQYFKAKIYEKAKQEVELFYKNYTKEKRAIEKKRTELDFKKSCKI
jgi:hypothetical protein